MPPAKKTAQVEEAVDQTQVVNNLATIAPMPVEMSTKQTTVLSESIAKQLQEPFPAEMLRFNQAKGLTYIPISEVIARMNRVLGFENWSYSVVRAWREPDHPDWCLAHVELSVRIGDREITRSGYGGQQIKKKKSGDVVDLGDEFKGAVSDALKKAAQSLGVGLELARTEEAKRWEEEAAAESLLDPAAIDAYDRLTSLTRQMGSEEKTALRNWWKATFGDIKVGPEAGVGSLLSACKLAEEIIEQISKVPVDPVDLIQQEFPGATVVEE